MLENLDQIRETIAPYTNAVSIGLLATGLLGTMGICYSIIKNPPKIKEDPLSLPNMHYDVLRELRESGILKEDENRFYIEKQKLTPEDIEEILSE